MLLQPSETLPEGPGWTYELKLDGYRALAIKTGGLVRLRSRNDKDFNGKYPVIAKALGALPDETVVDGEVVALDPDGRPSFSALQNHAAHAVIVYYVFDVLVFAGRNVMGEALAVRRDLLAREVLPVLAEHQPASVHPPLSAGVRIPSKRSFGQFGISNRSRAKTPPPTTIETSSGL